MSRHFQLFLFTACAVAVMATPARADETITAITRDHIRGDIYHYGFTVKVGDDTNARLRLHRVVRERAPWVPRSTVAGVMMLHGDFATFLTNFAPTLGTPASTAGGVAPYLAALGIDVWGVDRRWTTVPLDGAVDDFGDMGFAQETEDIGHALALARALRLATGSGLGQMTLAGFSRGGQLAYAYAALEATRPAWARHLRSLVPLDVFAVVPPEEEDTRAYFCEGAAFERDLIAEGFIDSDNLFVKDVGALALSAPTEPSPYFGRFDNIGALRLFAGQTYLFFPATPVYHLNGGDLSGGLITSLRESSESVVATWFAGAPPHQALQESADGDALWCGEGTLPVPYALEKIRVPLFYLGAAGGFGDHGLHSTTLVGSREVRTQVVRRFGPEREAEDFGHADLLYAADAAVLAWQPLAAWILEHR